MRSPFVNVRQSLGTACVLVTSLALSACYVDAGFTGILGNVTIEPTYSSYQRGDALSVTVSNAGGERVLLTTCASDLEREVDGDWVRVTFDIDNFSCPNVEYTVGRHESRTFAVDILTPTRRIPTSIPAGRYRIVLPELRQEGSGQSYSKNDRRSDVFYVE